MMRGVSFALVSCLVLASCIEYSSGVVDQPLPNDERLVGAWRMGNDEIVVQAVGSDKLLIIDSNHKTCKFSKHEATHTQIADQDFLDILSLDVSDHPGPFVTRYVFDDDKTHVSLYSLDEKLLKASIDAGEIKGTVETGGMFDMIHVDTSTNDLRDYIANHLHLVTAFPLVLTRANPEDNHCHPS